MQEIRSKNEERLKDGIDLGKATSTVLDVSYGGWYRRLKTGNRADGASA